ncbi:vitellogenin-1-like [Pseudonaja textilis]|uniref:vitellogenin-1-like n=1 Tax=Pseudonaja textilis TaxID=8673 RepID=UPI000EAA527F|nr:vitellogenin-1-like [Pseudonaja textilis]
MKAVILALALTLAGCQPKIDQTFLSPDKILLYDYEFEVQNRISEDGYSSAGLKTKCKVEIGKVEQDRKFLKVDCFEGLDYNGIYPWIKFASSPKLTAVFQKQLKNLIITFQHRNGHVDNIMVPDHVSEFALNLCKGILNLYENTIRNDQKTYSIKENGIEGRCDTTYLLQNTEKPDEFLMIKSKDLTTCDNMARKVAGVTYVIPCEFCRQKNKNFQGTSTYNYRIKNLKERDEKIILQVTTQEIQQFSPFREGTEESVIMEARQKLELIEAHSHLPQIPSNLNKRSQLLYTFKDSLPLPILLPKIKNRNKEIEDGLHYLANENVPKDNTRFLHLVNLLRTENEINYSEVFDRYYGQAIYRPIILDLISTTGSSTGLKYVRHKMVQQQITMIEAAQTLLVFFHFSNASEEVIEEAMAIMIDVLKGPKSLYRTSICLSYGSLLSRFYAVSNTNPDKYLKPLIDFATEAVRSSDIDASVLALKTFGNVRHIVVLKPIMKYLQSAVPSDIRIQQNAIMALRNPGLKDPMRVQGILLPIITNYKIAPLVRTCAAFVLLELKPTFPVLMTLANAMLHEPSRQVENFVFMYLSAIADSRSPEYRVMASSYRMVLKVLHEKNQRWAGYSASRYSHIEYFDEIYKARLGMNSMFLHEDENTQPTFIMANFKAIFMGSIFYPLEVGVQMQRIKEIKEILHQISKRHDSQQHQKEPSDQKITTDKLSDLEVYVKILGQEIGTAHIKWDSIQQMLQAYQKNVPLPWVKYAIDVLKNLPTIQWEKYFMSAEIQRVVPTCTGLPWQIGLVHIAHTKIAGDVQLTVTPELPSQITWPDIINSDMKLKTRLSLWMKKDMILNIGIITPEIYDILESKATVTANVPINMDAAINIKENTFKFELPPCKEETDIISLRLKTSAITSNIEEAPAAPVFFPANQSRTIESFEKSSIKGDERKDILPSEKKSAENLNEPLKKYMESVHKTKCFETCTFGCKACFHWANMSTARIAQKSIHNVVGEHVLKFSLKESDPNVPIEKLRFTIRGDACVANQMVHLFKNEEEDLVINKLTTIYSGDTDESTGSSSSSESGMKRIIGLKQVPTSQHQQYHPLNEKRELDDTSSSSSSSSSSDSSDSIQNDTRIYGRQQEGKGYLTGEKDEDKKKHTKRLAAEDDKKELQGQDLAKLHFRERQFEQSSSPLSYSDKRSRNESSWRKEAKTPDLLPYLTAVLEAVRSDSKEQGYRFSLYEKCDHYKTHFKVVAGELNQTKWRTCFDGLMIPFKSQYSLGWGNECKDYKVELKVSMGKVAIYKAIQLKMKWTGLPSLRSRYSFKLYLLLGIAYHLGFSTMYERNSAHEIIVRIIEKSPEAHVAIIKIPDVTFYKEDFYPEFFPTGIPTPHFQNPKLSKLNVGLWLSKEVEAVCEVWDERITTFDNKTFNTSIANRECDLLVVKDCTTSGSYKSQFQIWIHNPKPGFPKEIHISINLAEITIQDSLGELTVLHNKLPIPTNREGYEYNRENVEILRTTNNVIIKAPEFGLESVEYDGEVLRIKTSAKTQGKTCGLCGDYNGEMKHEDLIPYQAGREQY